MKPWGSWRRGKTPAPPVLRQAVGSRQSAGTNQPSTEAPATQLRGQQSRSQQSSLDASLAAASVHFGKKPATRKNKRQANGVAISRLQFHARHPFMTAARLPPVKEGCREPSLGKLFYRLVKFRSRLLKFTLSMNPCAVRLTNGNWAFFKRRPILRHCRSLFEAQHYCTSKPEKSYLGKI